MNFSAIDKYLEDNTENLINDLARIVAIPSKRGQAEEGKPFGAACALALDEMDKLAKSAGFKTQNLDNYMLECDYNGEETALGIIAHLDVVPEGDGWDSNPFELVKKDGAVFGRGTIDDKGPAIAAFYAVKALKENGVKLAKNVRLLFGSDEESGMGDLEYYRSKKALPEMMLSPDGEFPVINVEKGVCQFSFKKEYSVVAAPSLVSLKAGNVVNAVPEKAEAVVSGISEEQAKSAAAAADTSLKFDFVTCGEGVKIMAKGVSAHGSTPEKGDNALTGLMKV
ncbi:MAG: Sapep family Mn(2+)-dependent dipeptidase, partial [Clostridia bacterium]